MKKHLNQKVVRQTVQFFASAVVAVAVMGIGDLKAAPYADRNPNGSINVGNAGIFTVLTHGDFTGSDSSLVNGNVGVSGTGNFTLSNSATVNGDLYMNSSGTVAIKNSAKLNGQKKLNQNTLLNSAWADAISLSNAAAAESVTPRYSSITNVDLSGSSNLTITGNANEKVVLSLQNFQLTGSSSFTLQGTTTTTFIINVAKNFSLDTSASVNLVGVPTANVLFNVLGSKGKTQILDSSHLSGTLLALNRTVTATSSIAVTGRVIAQSVALSLSGKIVTPTGNQ